MNDHTRALFAEACGTFWFFFVGAGAILTDSVIGGTGLLPIAFAHGIALAIAISAFGALSGGHFNPAVTFGLAIAGRHPWPRVPTYWVAQLVGGVITGFVVWAVYGTAVSPLAPRIAGFGIGLTVFTDILVGGPLTGAAMNPARWFATAIPAGFFDNWWVYWVGPLLGAAIAGLSVRWVLAPPPDL